MSVYKKAIDFLQLSDAKMDAIFIIENQNKIVDSKGEWDIKDALADIFSVWESKEMSEIILLGKKYSILRLTEEAFVACSLTKAKNKIIVEDNIIAFKDENRAIISKLGSEGNRNIAYAELPRALSMISERKPYKDPKAKFGKDFDKLIAPAKVLFNTSQILQKMGLQKLGLTLDESKIYLSLLESGSNGEKVGNLHKKLDIKRPTIYAILDRLKEKEWVDIEVHDSLYQLDKSTKKASVFFARPLIELIDKTIQDKEAELRVLKSFRHIIRENIENGWKGVIDYDTLGITGINKDCGLVLFEFDRNIEQEKEMIKAVKDLFNLKIQARLVKNIDEKEVLPENHPNLIDLDDYTEYTKLKDLEEFAVDDKDFENYSGSIISVKFKKGSEAANNLGEDWVVLLNNVAIPVDNKIYLIWGSEEKFPTLLELILGFK